MRTCASAASALSRRAISARPCHSGQRGPRPNAGVAGRRASRGAPRARAPIIRIDPSFAHLEQRASWGRAAEENDRAAGQAQVAASADGAPTVELASAIYIASQRCRDDDRYTTAATTIHDSVLSQSAQSHQARVSRRVGWSLSDAAPPVAGDSTMPRQHCAARRQRASVFRHVAQAMVPGDLRAARSSALSRSAQPPAEDDPADVFAPTNRVSLVSP